MQGQAFALAPFFMSATHQWGTQAEMFGPRHEHRLGMILAEVDRAGVSVVLDAAVGLGQLAGRMLERGHIVYVRPSRETVFARPSG